MDISSVWSINPHLQAPLPLLHDINRLGIRLASQSILQPRSIYPHLPAPLFPLHDTNQLGIRFASQSILQPRSIYQASLPPLHYINQLGIWFKSQSIFRTMAVGYLSLKIPSQSSPNGFIQPIVDATSIAGQSPSTRLHISWDNCGKPGSYTYPWFLEEMAEEVAVQERFEHAKILSPGSFLISRDDHIIKIHCKQ